MSTKLEKLSGENNESLQRLEIITYLDGQCYEFAVALHRGLGWPLVGVMSGNPAGVIIRHALAQSPDGKFWDIRGPVKKSEIGTPFGIASEPVLQPVTEEDLRKTRKTFGHSISDEAIEHASLVAEGLWPELPWRKETFQKRVLAFMDELETLCKKHEVWIRAPYPAARIVVGKAYGDEKGFRISPTLNGQYFFDREL